MEPSLRDEAAPKKHRRRWPRRLVVLFVVLLLLVVAAPLALALPFVRNIVATKVGQAIGRPVTIDGAFAFWGKGIDLDGITVTSPEGFDEPLAQVKHVHIDLDVLALIGGRLDADIDVVEPRIVFLKDADDRSNADGLFEKEAEPEDETQGPKGHRIRLEVTGGVVRARQGPDAAWEELRDLDVVAVLGSDGALGLTLCGQATDAASGGGDAALSVEASVPGEGDGPVKVEIPPLDLSRLAGIVEGATGIRGLRGRLEADIDATVEVADTLAISGRLDVRADGPAFETPSGLSFAAERVTMTARFERGDAGDAGEITCRAEHIDLRDESGPRAHRFREPLVELTLTGRRLAAQEGEEGIVVETGRLSAGQALAITVSKPWQVKTGESPSAAGQLDIRADLGRLANLRALVPALDAIRGGQIVARVVARAEQGLDVSMGLRAVGLDFAPCETAPRGYREAEVVVQLRARRPEGEGDVPTSILLHRIQSSILTLAPATGSPPLELTISEAGVGAKGSIAGTLHLEPLARAIGGALGLVPGDRMIGTVRLQTEANIEGGVGRASLGLDGKDLVLPASWAEGVPPTHLVGQAVLVLGEETARVEVPTFAGFGLDLRGVARLDRSPGGKGLTEATVHLTGDLARARPLLAPLLGLPAGDRLAGSLVLDTRVVEDEAARRLVGGLTVSNLRWHDASGTVVLDEPRLEVKHDVSMATSVAGTRYGFEELTFVSQALQARLAGSASTTEDGMVLDTTLKLTGDAARLAGVLRGVMGEDYRDLRGSGRVDGEIGLRGGTANGAETLLLSGTMKPGHWSTGGLTLEGTTLGLERAAVADPLAVTLSGTANRGRLDLTVHAKLERAANPWSLDVKLARVDTSPLLVDHGVGRYLAYFLPTLLPPDAMTPVLSGLLDAEVAVAAVDLAEPRLESSLKGRGWIRMDQGAIGNSTLFGAVGGGKGLGNVGRVLLLAVPEVGQSLASLSQSLAFSRVESQFTVANRVVNIQKGLLEGERVRIGFRGTVGFNQAVNLRMDVALSGTAGKRLAKVLPSQTIPLAVTGKLGSPTVVPDLDTSDLITTGVLDGLLPGGREGEKSPLDRLRDLIPR